MLRMLFYPLPMAMILVPLDTPWLAFWAMLLQDISAVAHWRISSGIVWRHRDHKVD